MELKYIIKTNKPIVAILLFYLIYSIIYLWKPKFLFIKPNDTIRQFGIGYNNKTILPLWLFSILLSILCYLIILYYINYQKIIL